MENHEMPFATFAVNHTQSIASTFTSLNAKKSFSPNKKACPKRNANRYPSYPWASPKWIFKNETMSFSNSMKTLSWKNVRIVDEPLWRADWKSTLTVAHGVMGKNTRIQRTTSPQRIIIIPARQMRRILPFVTCDAESIPRIQLVFICRNVKSYFWRGKKSYPRRSANHCQRHQTRI
jgi:hypothetical protein